MRRRSLHYTSRGTECLTAMRHDQFLIIQEVWDRSMRPCRNTLSFCVIFKSHCVQQFDGYNGFPDLRLCQPGPVFPQGVRQKLHGMYRRHGSMCLEAFEWEKQFLLDRWQHDSSPTGLVCTCVCARVCVCVCVCVWLCLFQLCFVDNGLFSNCSIAFPQSDR